MDVNAVGGVYLMDTPTPAIIFVWAGYSFVITLSSNWFN
jgi:hypothetical protein